MGFGKADLVLQVSHEVNDNGQKHAQYRISNVDIVPETSFHIQGMVSEVRPQFPFCIEKMVPWIGEPYKKVNAGTAKAEYDPGFQGIDGPGIKKSYHQPQNRNEGRPKY